MKFAFIEVVNNNKMIMRFTHHHIAGKVRIRGGIPTQVSSLDVDKFETRFLLISLLFLILKYNFSLSL